MDEDSDFLQPSHESMEVNSTQPNIVAGPSQITISLPNKRPAQDVLAILALQLPPNKIRAEKLKRNYAGNALGQNVMAVGQRYTAKTHVMTATE